MRREKEWRYVKLNRVLKEFDSTQTNLNGRKLNLKRSKNRRGKIAFIRTHENEIGCSFAEFDRENLYWREINIDIHR